MHKQFIYNSNQPITENSKLAPQQPPSYICRSRLFWPGGGSRIKTQVYQTPKLDTAERCGAVWEGPYQCKSREALPFWKRFPLISLILPEGQITDLSRTVPEGPGKIWGVSWELEHEASPHKSSTRVGIEHCYLSRQHNGWLFFQVGLSKIYEWGHFICSVCESSDGSRNIHVGWVVRWEREDQESKVCDKFFHNYSSD